MKIFLRSPEPQIDQRLWFKENTVEVSDIWLLFIVVFIGGAFTDIGDNLEYTGFVTGTFYAAFKKQGFNRLVFWAFHRK